MIRKKDLLKRILDIEKVIIKNNIISYNPITKTSNKIKDATILLIDEVSIIKDEIIKIKDEIIKIKGEIRND